MGRLKPSAAGVAVRVAAEFIALAILLFLARFVARAYLVTQMDEECHVGAIASEVLAHGVRFPLLAYAPTEYNNGSFFAGLLVALSWAVFGRSVLGTKLVTHFISTAGALAALWLLRRCFDELEIENRWARWTGIGVLIVAVALGTRVVTIISMASVGLGSPAEGAAIMTMLLALFAYQPRQRGIAQIFVFWLLTGFALYLNKGTILVIPVCAAAELLRAWRSPWRLGAAAIGFIAGNVPDLVVVANGSHTGWAIIIAKLEERMRAFPQAFVESITIFADHRVGLLILWALGIANAAWIVARAMRHRQNDPASARQPETIMLVVGFTAINLVALCAMAQGSVDPYTIYGYPALIVLIGLLCAELVARAARAWGATAARVVGTALLVGAAVLYWPGLMIWGSGSVEALWRNRAGAACSWHLAEGFEREFDRGLVAPGPTRAQHVIERCRSLAGEDQVLDCIGGLGRPTFRPDEKFDPDLLSMLNTREREAYAFYYGIRRTGDPTACADLREPALAAECATAVQLECLVFVDTNTRYFTGHEMAPPRCPVREPPMDGYWAARRRDLLASRGTQGPYLDRRLTDNLLSCQPILDACYRRPT